MSLSLLCVSSLLYCKRSSRLSVISPRMLPPHSNQQYSIRLQRLSTAHLPSLGRSHTHADDCACRLACTYSNGLCCSTCIPLQPQLTTNHKMVCLAALKVGNNNIARIPTGPPGAASSKMLDDTPATGRIHLVQAGSGREMCPPSIVVNPAQLLGQQCLESGATGHSIPDSVPQRHTAHLHTLGVNQHPLSDHQHIVGISDC